MAHFSVRKPSRRRAFLRLWVILWGLSRIRISPHGIFLGL